MQPAGHPIPQLHWLQGSAELRRTCEGARFRVVSENARRRILEIEADERLLFVKEYRRRTDAWAPPSY